MQKGGSGDCAQRPADRRGEERAGAASGGAYETTAHRHGSQQGQQFPPTCRWTAVKRR